MVFHLQGNTFPDPRKADSDGLVAFGGDLSPNRLLVAYSSGIFPWTVKPVTWWSPDPRGIIELEEFHVPRSLQKFLRKNPFRLTSDVAFREVMEGCAESGPGRRETWVTPEFIEAYTRLHQLGHAHSVECWLGDSLVGGVYGVQIEAFFAGESMFHRVTNASKVALHALVQVLLKQRFLLFDVQMPTTVTTLLGARNIRRTRYLERLERALREPRKWEAQRILSSATP